MESSCEKNNESNPGGGGDNFKQALIANKSKLITIKQTRFVSNLVRNGIFVPPEFLDNPQMPQKDGVGLAGAESENGTENHEFHEGQLQPQPQDDEGMEKLISHLITLFDGSDNCEDLFSQIMDSVRQCGHIGDIGLAKEITNDCKEIADLSSTMELLQNTSDASDDSILNQSFSQGQGTATELANMNLQPSTSTSIGEIRIKQRQDLFESTQLTADSQNTLRVEPCAIKVKQEANDDIVIVKQEIKTEPVETSEQLESEDDFDEFDESNDDEETEMEDWAEEQYYDDYNPFEFYFAAFARRYGGHGHASASTPQYRTPHAERMTIKDALLRQNVSRHSSKGFTFHATLKIKRVNFGGQDDMWYTGCPHRSNNNPQGQCRKMLKPQAGGTMLRCSWGHECDPKAFIPVARLYVMFCDRYDEQSEMEGVLWEEGVETLLGMPFNLIRQKSTEELKIMTAGKNGSIYEVEVECKKGFRGDAGSSSRSNEGYWNTMILIKKVQDGPVSATNAGPSVPSAQAMPTASSSSENPQHSVKRPRTSSPVSAAAPNVKPEPGPSTESGGISASLSVQLQATTESPNPKRVKQETTEPMKY